MKRLDEARRKQREREERSQTVTSLRQAISRIGELEKHIEAIRALKKASPRLVIHPREKGSVSEAVAIAVATDWHLGATVESKTVNGLNEYNVAVAEKRVETFFERTVRMTRKERQDIKISELILFLGGDLIEGALHLDTIMSNEVAAPIEQAVICQALIESGLNFLQNHGGFKRITVVCCDGNHGRITHRMHWTSRRGNSLEWYMYYTLAQRFPQLTWRMAHGIHEYVGVYDRVIRFHHGDTIYFGGINGPYTYLNRKTQEWDKAIRADYSVQGHLHCYTLGTRRWLINGSLIGYTPYATALSGEFQPPIQAFFLWDKARGPTVQIPILL